MWDTGRSYEPNQQSEVEPGPTNFSEKQTLLLLVIEIFDGLLVSITLAKTLQYIYFITQNVTITK